MWHLQLKQLYKFTLFLQKIVSIPSNKLLLTNSCNYNVTEIIKEKKFIILLLMDSFKDESLPENVRCLINHKIKARMLKNSMMRDKINRHDDSLGAKIIKYETFLSQNMIEKIKTEDIVVLQDEVRQYCSKKKSLVPVKIESSEKALNIHSLFEQIKKEVKQKAKCKRRSKTFQSPEEKFILLAKPTQLIRRQISEGEQAKSNEIVRTQCLENCQMRGKTKQIGLKGKIINNNLINIIQKMQEMKYLSQKTGRKLGLLIDDRPSPQKLKEEKERLNTTQNNQRVKFTPIGKISGQIKPSYQSQDKLLVTHMPKINKSNQKNEYSRISMHGQRKIAEVRKSALKLDNQMGIKFKTKRQSALNPNNRLQADIQNDQIIEVNCF